MWLYKSTNNIGRVLLFALAVVLGLSSCQYKPLCYDHDPHALKYQIRVVPSYDRIWEYSYEGIPAWAQNWPVGWAKTYDHFCPAIPEGLRATVYNEDGTFSENNLPADGGVVYMSEGAHPILFYNNDTEYIIFNDMNIGAAATASTRTRTRATYIGNPYAPVGAIAENTVTPPDMLYGSFLPSYEHEKVPAPLDVEVSMRPLVFTYYIRCNIEKGLKYVALVRGALSGMAEGVRLNDGVTSAQEATFLFDCEKTDFGAEAELHSFGVPNFPNDNYTKAEGTHALNIEVMLRNGTILSFDRDVTDQLESQPLGGVIEVDGIEIDDEIGLQGSSAFEVEVDDWGEFNDIVVPL